MEEPGHLDRGRRVPLELRLPPAARGDLDLTSQWQWALVGPTGLVPVLVRESPLNNHPDGPEWAGSGSAMSLRLAAPFTMASFCDGSARCGAFGRRLHGGGGGEGACSQSARCCWAVNGGVT